MDFEQDVIARSADVPVVVDFWADWCGPCKTLGPILDREVGARGGEVELVKVDVDAEKELAERFGISGIPAVKAFRNGRVVSEFVGVRSPQLVASFLDELTAPTLADELRASGDDAELLEALEDGDYERALDLLASELEDADTEGRERIRQRMVQLFAELGHDHELSARYRRRLAAALY